MVLADGHHARWPQRGRAAGPLAAVQERRTLRLTARKGLRALPFQLVRRKPMFVRQTSGHFSREKGGVRGSGERYFFANSQQKLEKRNFGAKKIEQQRNKATKGQGQNSEDGSSSHNNSFYLK
jgi:hypothetical protein